MTYYKMLHKTLLSERQEEEEGKKEPKWGVTRRQDSRYSNFFIKTFGGSFFWELL